MNVRKWLASIWRAWKRLGRAIGDLIGRLVLTLFYFTIFVPFGLGARLFRRHLDDGAGNGNWIPRELEPDDMMKGKRLY